VHLLITVGLAGRKGISEGPFVAKNVVSAEILEINPAKADDRLSFLLESK
jgi:hypothetical protein